MKRFEKMSKEEIMEFITKCNTCDCKNCPGANRGTRMGCLINYLNAKVTLKKRWQTITSNEDVVRLHSEFESFCGNRISCVGCPYKGESSDSDCYDSFLCEEVEVPI